MSLLTVGTMAFDALETPFGKRDRIIGGSGTYIALTASYFTSDLSIVSIIGDDFPQEVLDNLQKRGIRLDGVEIKKGEKSFFWSGRYHNDMNSRDTLVTDLNVLADFNPIVPEKERNADFLMLGNVDPVLQKKVIEQMNQRPQLIAMDTMNFWMDHARPALDEVLGMVDMLLINDEEARQLTGEYSLVKAAQQLFNLGLKYLIIKKGEHGALMFDKDQAFFAPALPLEDVFDPTGAGDCFAGGFVGYLAKTKDLSIENRKRAIIHGSAMASFCVEKFGPERVMEINQDDINHRLEAFVRLSQFDLPDVID